MFIQTEATPNPATLKFLPGRVVLPETTFEARDPASAARSPLASALFAVPGVAGVYFGHDFISVTKAEDGSAWPQVKPAILGAIMEHFQSGAPVMDEGSHDEAEGDEEFYDEADHDTVITIKDAGAPGCGGRRRRHHLPWLQGGRGLPRDEGRLLGLPVLDRDAAPWRAEPVPPLPAGGARGPGGLITAVWPPAQAGNTRPRRDPDGRSRPGGAVGRRHRRLQRDGGRAEGAGGVRRAGGGAGGGGAVLQDA